MLSGNSDSENNLLIEHASDATVFKSCELPNSTKDTMRMYRPLYMN